MRNSIVRIIITVLLALIAAFLIYLNVSFIVDYMSGKPLAVLGSIIFFIYGIPVVAVTFIYELIVIIRKKIFLPELISAIAVIVFWFLLYFIPAVL